MRGVLGVFHPERNIAAQPGRVAAFDISRQAEHRLRLIIGPIEEVSGYPVVLQDEEPVILEPAQQIIGELRPRDGIALGKGF